MWQAAEAVFKELQESGDLGQGVSAGLLHGKLVGEEKTAALQAFSSGEKPVLVSTSVVEVSPGAMCSLPCSQCLLSCGALKLLICGSLRKVV